MAGARRIEMSAFRGGRRVHERRPDRDESAGVGSVESDVAGAGGQAGGFLKSGDVILISPSGRAAAGAMPPGGNGS